MVAIAPNLTIPVCELVDSEKFAEKALFKALKTKDNTPNHRQVRISGVEKHGLVKADRGADREEACRGISQRLEEAAEN